MVKRLPKAEQQEEIQAIEEGARGAQGSRMQRESVRGAFDGGASVARRAKGDGDRRGQQTVAVCSMPRRALQMQTRRSSSYGI